MKLVFSIVIMNIVLVTLVDSQCIEQRVTSQFYDISVNVPEDNTHFQFYTLCPSLEDELFGLYGNITCTQDNECNVTEVVPFNKEPVLNILNKLSENKTYFRKSVCKHISHMIDGLLNLTEFISPVYDGYFFNKEKMYLAAWDTTSFKFNHTIPIYRGQIDKLILNDTSQYISFIHFDNNYTLALNESNADETYIIVKPSNSTTSYLKQRLFEFIKRKNIYIPFCKNGYICRRYTDSPSLLNFYISLSFNIFTLIIIAALSFFVWRAWKNDNYSEAVHVQPKPPTEDPNRPSTYSKFTNNRIQIPPRTIIEQNYEQSSAPPLPPPRYESGNSGSYMDPTEFHEYFTVGSNIPKKYAVLNKKQNEYNIDGDTVKTIDGPPGKQDLWNGVVKEYQHRN